MGNITAFLKNNTADINSICELGAGRFENFPFYQCSDGTHDQDGTTSFGFADNNLENKLIASGNDGAAKEAQRHKSKWYVPDLTSLGFIVDHDKNHHSKKNLELSKHLHGSDGGTVMWAVWNK